MALLARMVGYLLSVGLVALMISQASSSPIHDLSDTQDVKMYLTEFGYIDVGQSETDEEDEPTTGLQDGALSDAVSVISRPKFVDGLKKFQRMANLPVTGVLDEATMEKMRSSRCGNKDVKPTHRTPDHPDDSIPERFTAKTKKWKKHNLTYALLNYPSKTDLPPAHVKRIIQRAFEYWDDASRLTFREADNPDKADFKLSFVRYDHGDSNPMDGPDGTLAHAFPPRQGVLHFDDDEFWTNSDIEDAYQLLQTTTHEIGHMLGLSHSAEPNSVMMAFYPGFDGALQLAYDDIDGIQTLYGPDENE